MASPVDVASAIEALPERRERLHKAFSELESKKNSLNKIAGNWKDVDEYLKEIERSLRKTIEDYNTKEKALEAKMTEGQAALDKRDAEVSAREQASLARVQEQKDVAIAAILEQKRKWSEERQRLHADTKKEQTAKAANGSVSQPMDVDVKAAAGDSGNPALDFALSGLLDKGTSVKDKAKTEVKPRPQLKSLCENMDADGLRKFIAEHRKDLNALSAELPFAMKFAKDPTQLVLKALEGYHPSEQNASQGAKKDLTLPANRRACVILLEALAEVLADPVLGVEHPIVPSDVKKVAKQVADLWKSKMNLEGDLGSNFSLDAQSFLQLLATFGLASDYDQDELCKLITTIARRKQTPALCRSLGLSAKVPDVVEKLIKDRKTIEALFFASAFDLLDRFQPVPLLKAHLRDSRKLAQAALKSGHNSAAAQNEANQKELSSLKAVLKAINEYKIEDKYQPAPLEKRIAQLEKAKADKKRSATAAKTQLAKRPRTNSAPSGTGAASEKPFFRGSDRAQYGASPYGAGAQPGYDHRPLSTYSSIYGGGNRSPVSLPSSYLYPSDGLGSLGYGSSALVNASSSYGGYNYGSGLGSGLGMGPSGFQSYLR